MFKNALFILLPCMLAFSFIEKRNSPEYNFASPSEIVILPDILYEISGLTLLDSVHVVCIQDENGILFIYNIREKKLVKEVPFYYDGDYEGIARVGKKIYVLRSDGTLYEINDFNSEEPDVKIYVTGIPAGDNEGLCYDEKNQRLLIAVKGEADKTIDKNVRLIYAFDLKSNSMKKEPAYRYKLKTINDFIVNNNLPVKRKRQKTKDKNDENKEIKFATSAIGIHPINRKLYLLSANDHMLFVFNLKGEILHAESLDPTIYNKAEGITFLDNGDLIISNEGQGKKPTLVFLAYKK